MARPTRQGIDYFPYDVDLDQDDKLLMIIGEFKYKGEAIYTKLLAWIYKHQGYYVEWTEMEQLKFAKRVSYIGDSSVNLINDVVARCVKWGLFDKSLFESSHILTSIRIQKTWLDASRKRKDRIIDPTIWLLKTEEITKKAEETQSSGSKAEEMVEKAEETPQSKVKESKENKSTGFIEAGKPASPPKKSLEEKQKDMEKRQKEFYESLVPYVGEYTKEMIRAFYNYWSEPNKGRTKFKKEMQDTWDTKLRLVTWEKNQFKFKQVQRPEEQQGLSPINQKLKAAVQRQIHGTTEHE